MGKGYYEGKTNAAIQSDDDELQKMAEHMMGDLCTPGNPRDLTVEGAEILRDCMYDGMDVKTSNGHRQNIWGIAPRWDATAGYGARGSRRAASAASRIGRRSARASREPGAGGCAPGHFRRYI